MSVTETYEPELIETDGSETDFDFAFSVFDDSDLVVAIVDPDTLEVLDTPELGVDYTVTLNTSTVGGTVVFGTAPADDQLVSIRRNIPTTQGTDIPSGGLFRESQIENALDKAILLIQQLEEQVNRSLLQNPYSTALDLVMPAPEAGSVLGWNSTEDALINLTPNTEAYITKAAQAEAEAGTENTKYTTPLRVSQAITALAPKVPSRVTTITSAAEPAVNVDTCDAVTITALAAAITSMTTNLTGTPVNFQKLLFRIKDDGTARAITWGAKFVAKGVALPTTTVLGKLLTVGFIYDSVATTWGCVASAQEA